MSTQENEGILILSPFYYPNIGGVETHLSDLTSKLNSLNYMVYVLTYSPITTPNVPWNSQENQNNIHIRRFRWFGKNLFHALEKYPILDFIYLSPYLLIRSFMWLLNNHKKISVIHSHGFNAAFIGNILAFVFHKKHITSSHAIYDNAGKISQLFIRIILSHTNQVLCLSQASADQLISWGISPKKIALYRYWIDLDLFKPSIKVPKIFTILFVGRLIRKKGIYLFIQLAKKFPKFNFIIVGSGPEEERISQISQSILNITFLGFIPNKELNTIYLQSSILCIPSLYEEGFGRVVIESIASGLPVVASNLGGLPEALDSSVAVLIKPNIKNFTLALKRISNPNLYYRLKSNCRQFAVKKFSSDNIKMITRFY